MLKLLRFLPGCASALLSIAAPALAQTDDGEAPRRSRVALGVQIVPRFPGSDDQVVRPLFDLATARGDDPFPFEAADENPGFSVYDRNGFEFGPVFSIESARRRRDVGANVDEVGTTVELGGSAAYWFTPSVRAYGEVRKGVNGHGGVVSDLSLDYVARDGDKWLASIGPRLSLADAKYRRAYYGVSAREVAAGMPAYSVGNNPIQSVGLSSTVLYQLTRRWGLYGYAAYDRLVASAADSPQVTRYGARDQLSGGLALSVTFGRGVR